MSRRLGAMLGLACLLVACEDSPPPGPVPAKPPAPIAQPEGPTAPLKAAVPLVTPKPPVAPVPPAPRPAKPSPAPAVPKSKEKAAAPTKERLAPKVRDVPPSPPAPLDLSVPEEWARHVEGDPGTPSADPTLLPPLFEQQVPPSSFQLGGRLIPDERQEEIEGAEISIEIRR